MHNQHMIYYILLELIFSSLYCNSAYLSCSDKELPLMFQTSWKTKSAWSVWSIYKVQKDYA